MGQTFSQFRTRLQGIVKRDDLASSYGLFVNEALRAIQDRRSWTFMKKTTEPLTVPTGTGNQTVALPSGFKELQKRPAVHYITDDGQYIPAEVVTEEQQDFRIWAFGGTPIVTWPPRVYYERKATGPILGVVEPLSEPFNFRVKHYSYLADLANDGDTSPFIDNYPRMVLAKAKEIAFKEINDPVWEECESDFEARLLEAIRADAYAETRGMETHM